MDDQYIGFLLAILSTAFIGASFVLKKKGLIASAPKLNHELACLKSPVWWLGTILMGLGEAANFAAYSFAPAILVTPLGCLSVVISAVLASIFLREKLDNGGKIGCLLCIVGSTIIVLHAPPEHELSSINELLQLALEPLFLAYAVTSVLFLLISAWKIAPRFGRRHLLVYVSMCSVAGSLSVIGCKGVGIAIKLSVTVSNQFIYGSTYAFLATVVLCVIYQLTYLNKALDNFATSSVSTVYYVMFTTLTIISNLILFQGFNGIPAADVISLLLGFLTMCIGVALVHKSQAKEEIQTAISKQQVRDSSFDIDEAQLSLLFEPEDA